MDKLFSEFVSTCYLIPMAIHQTPPPTCLLACRAIATSAAREAMDVPHFRSAKFLFIIRGQRADMVLTVVT